MPHSKTAFYLLALVAAVLVAASAFSHLYGNVLAMQAFFHARWFVGLWGLTCAVAVWHILRSHLWKRPAMLAIHLSLLLILCGALLTHLTAREGRLTLRSGAPPTNLYLADNNHVFHLPFAVPSDTLIATLNHPYSKAGHRLYLLNEKPTGERSYLVVKNTWGFTLSNIGYSALILSFILFVVFNKTKEESTLRIEVSNKEKRWRRVSLAGLIILVGLYIWRGSLVGHLPLMNGSEVWHFCALCACALALVVRAAPCLVVAACAVVLSALTAEPVYTPTAPVLHSWWLAIHVSIIVIAYTLLAYLALVPSRSVLRWAVAALTVGIFLGAAWAGQAWGRQWGWDPKEVWALITLLVYILPLHQKSLPWFRAEKHLRWYLRLAFLSVLFTYFGVNYFLGGLHSYAG